MLISKDIHKANQKEHDNAMKIDNVKIHKKIIVCKIINKGIIFHFWGMNPLA